MTTRKIIESPLYQGTDEQIAYDVDFSKWGTPSSPVVKIYDSSGTDQTTTCLNGTATVNGDVVTTPTVKSLIIGETYRLEIKVTINSNLLEAYAEIVGEK